MFPWPTRLWQRTITTQHKHNILLTYLTLVIIRSQMPPASVHCGSCINYVKTFRFPAVFQVRCADGPFESTGRSYFRVTESLEASSRPTQTVMDANHWERSECTQHRSAHGMEMSSGSWTMATNRGRSCAPPNVRLPLMMMIMFQSK